MGAIVQNGNIGAIIKNGIVYGGGIIDGSGQINEIVKLSETEWGNLSTKDDNKIYEVYNNSSNPRFYTKIYQGENRILSKLPSGTSLNDWEFWYEDLYYYQSSLIYNKIEDTNLKIFSSSNSNKDFELVFSGTPTSGYYNGIIYPNSNSQFECRINHGNYPNNIIVTGLFNDSGFRYIPYTYGSDFKLQRINGIYTAYVGGAIVDTYSQSSGSSESGCYIGCGNNSSFTGTIDYIGFRWLDTPTPSSGADGLTYEVSVDNNYTLHLIEYDNGTQSQTASLTDSDLSSPVTFGDIVISYANDTFIIKPDYTNGKSIKYDNVLYSGDNAIEFYEGEAGLPDYAEQGTFTLIGWIE